MLGPKSAQNHLKIMEQIAVVIIPGVHTIYNHRSSIVGIHNTSSLVEHASSFTIEGAGGGYAWVEEYIIVYLLY